MTTNVTITSTYIMKPKKLRIRQVDPKDETKVYREILADDPTTLGAETLVIHDGAKLVIEEVD